MKFYNVTNIMTDQGSFIRDFKAEFKKEGVSYSCFISLLESIKDYHNSVNTTEMEDTSFE